MTSYVPAKDAKSEFHILKANCGNYHHLVGSYPVTHSGKRALKMILSTIRGDTITEYVHPDYEYEFASPGGIKDIYLCTNKH